MTITFTIDHFYYRQVFVFQQKGNIFTAISRRRQRHCYTANSLLILATVPYLSNRKTKHSFNAIVSLLSISLTKVTNLYSNFK